jgi:hypothetical protein
MKRTLIIDGDTLLYSSAAQQQKNRCNAINIASGEEVLYESKTDFNKWLASQEKHTKEDFIFQVVPELVGKPEYAFKAIKEKVGKIFNRSYCDDLIFIQQGAGNFRNDYTSEHVIYKGQRGDKPILFRDCFEYAKKKYADKGEGIVTQGIETDDLVCMKGWEAFHEAVQVGKKSSSRYVIAYCDKDIPANTPGFMLNYGKDESIFWNTKLSQTKQLMAQLLTGDDADNIPGLLRLSDESKKQYGINRAGVGKVAAEKILGDCTTEKELAFNVVECYKSAWPEDWYVRLKDNGFFLYLLRHADDKWCVDKYFGQWGITL